MLLACVEGTDRSVFVVRARIGARKNVCDDGDDGDDDEYDETMMVIG